MEIEDAKTVNNREADFFYFSMLYNLNSVESYWLN